MGAADVHLVEVRDAAVAGRYGDVLELNVHIILGIEELAAVGLAGGDFESDDVALGLVEELDGDADCGRHDCGVDGGAGM